MRRIFVLFALMTLPLVSFTQTSGQSLPPKPDWDKTVQAVQDINSEIQKKIDTAPVVNEITKALPSKEQAVGFFGKLWSILWSIVKFFSVIFEWLIGVVSNIFYRILHGIGLEFFKPQ